MVYQYLSTWAVTITIKQGIKYLSPLPGISPKSLAKREKQIVLATLIRIKWCLIDDDGWMDVCIVDRKTRVCKLLIHQCLASYARIISVYC